ncbi:RHS repeat domain-containing protein [Ferruginibacter sp.]
MKKINFLLPKSILLLIIIVSIHNTCAANSRQVAEEPKSSRKNLENHKLIYAPWQEELNWGTAGIVQLGERLINIEKGKKDVGDSTSYLFDQQGRLALKKNYNNKGKLKETTSYKYDSTGNLLSINAKNNDGGAPFAMTFTYNTSGQITVTKTSYSSVTEKVEYKYDAGNYLIASNELDNKNRVIKRTNYFYDKAGNLVLCIIRSAKMDTLTIDKYRYNNQNQCIQSEHSGEPVNCAGRNKWQMTYNASGDIIVEKTSDLVVKYKYEYDVKKRWTKQYNFYNDETEPNFLTRRTIVYRN